MATALGLRSVARAAENKYIMSRRFQPQREESSSATLLGSYQRTLFWSRLFLTVFFVVYVVTLLWALPLLPIGLTAADYNERTAPLLFLLFVASTTAFGAVYLRDRKRRIEQTLHTWNSVHHGLSDLRGREYFYNRIVIECQRAQARQSRFTVVVLRLQGEKEPSSQVHLDKALSALEAMVKEFDCLAAISSHEIGVLAPSVTEQNASDFTRRVQETVASALPEGSVREVEAAYVIYGLDATDAGELLGTARSRNLASTVAKDIPGTDADRTAPAA